MDILHTTGSQHELGSWHPAMRPNAHGPDVVKGEDFGQESLESKVSRDEIEQDGLHAPNGDQPEPPIPLPGEERNRPNAPAPKGLDQSVNSNFSPLPAVHKDTAPDDQDELANDSHTEEVQGKVTDIGATGPLTAGSQQDLGQKIDGLEKIVANREEYTEETSAEPSAESNNVEDILGNKDEMEKAWESELNPATRGSLSRTNSFPEVPSLRQNEAIPPHSLPHSQVEDIMEESVKTESLEHGSSNIIASGLAAAEPSQDPFESARDEEHAAFFDNPQGIQPVSSTAAADEESRFEEGLPLMPSTSQQENLTLPQDQTHEAEAAAFPAVDDEDDFFDKVSPSQTENTSTFSPPPLDRKSTTQVLESMHYPPHSANHAESEPTEDTPSLANLTGSGIAASTSTVKSQVFAEQDINLAESEPKDEDLAEMWKAALGDDDLLEEDLNSMDPSSFFQDDGEGLLEGSEDEAGEFHPESATSPPLLEPIYSSDGSMQGFGNVNTKRSSSENKDLPPSAYQPQQVSSYPHHPGQNGAMSVPQNLQSTFGLNQTAYSSTRIANAMGQYPSTAIAPPSRPQMPASTQSFADKSKGGYTSPYDLPMDVTRPKKRTTYQQVRPSSDAQPTSNRPPPPRSSSMFTGTPLPVEPQPPVPRLPGARANPPTGSSIPPSLKASPSVGSFFEDLPSSKTRPSSSLSRNAPLASRPTPPMASQRNLPRQPSLTQQPAPGSSSNSQQYQLLPPERMSLYGSAPQAEPSTQTIPAMNARYSPAPTKTSSIPPPPNRYAASPSAGTRPPPSQALSFQPRTSSPLAHNHALSPQNHQNSVIEPPLRRPQSSGRQGLSSQESPSTSLPFPSHQSSEDTHQNAYQGEYESNCRAPHLSQLRESPPTLNASLQARLSNTPSDSSYAIDTPEPGPLSSDGSPQQSSESRMTAPGVSMQCPTRRSQTQSPGDGKHRSELPGNIQNPYQRPASVNDQVSSPSAETRPPGANQPRPRGRTFSKQLNYVGPTDGREMDHLERWKGCPIISFGFGGAIVTSFPKQIPRYAAGQNTPMIKCSPGEVKLQDGKILPLDEDIASFPGPLKSKGKKKDVIDWLQRRILKLENEERRTFSSGVLPDPRKRHEEKTLLWKIVRVLVEHDGVVDGNASAEKAVRSILSPEPTQGDDAAVAPQSFNAPLRGISPHGSHNVPDSGNLEAFEDLRKILLHGEREKAVWHAVDNRLWAHAMLLSSTLDKNIWKQVSQEFVRQEVKTLGDNTESLAALYQIFAGNWDESIDELVPPSARAGLQMVSKTASTGPTKNALDGLDRWRETLTLILSNRSPDDGKALVSLGQLLAGYGRTEAAHICYIFAKTPGLFGGADDPQVSVALLGADHLQHPFDYGRDLDSILLTEVYDFVRTVLASFSAATVSPHLQSYKLYHAMILAEYGFKTEVQQYCEVITSALKSTTKPSPHYHSLLFGALDDLVDRLRQAPRDSSGSWISKPSIDKVSGSIWAKFNQYVAGDESDAASTGSGKAIDQDAGPFARVAGGSPTLSRTPSSGDLYSTYPAGVGISPSAQMANPSNSRYAPAGLYTPRSSLEQTGRSSQEYSRPTQADLLRPAFGHQQYQSRPTSSAGSHHEPYKPVSQPSNYPPQTESYLPTPPSQPEYMPVGPPDELSSSLYQRDPYQPTPPLEPQPFHVRDESVREPVAMNEYEPPSSSYNPLSYAYEPPSTGDYEPPSSSGYNPPSYNPEIPQAAESPVEEKPKKKSFMDDDGEDDFETRAAALREEKARKDREADEAFRRAAEADGKIQFYPSFSYTQLIS